VGQILVTTGGGQLGAIGYELAQALLEGIPGIRVGLVRGPHASNAMPPGVALIDAPTSLLGPLLAADLVVSAAGQTMLEAAACGTPCVALPLIENQRNQGLRLAANGAVRIVTPSGTDDVLATVRNLVDDAGARRELCQNGQKTIDGYGALRVAFHIEGLLGESGLSVNANI
jgi:spore coat polysaccharide biosynthesis predicted glycosyltransferase SpsG